jgi:hypothetical protein
MPRPEHIEEGDVVEQVFRQPGASNTVERIRRGRVLKIEKGSARVKFEGRNSPERVMLNMLRVFVDPTKTVMGQALTRAGLVDPKPPPSPPAPKPIGPPPEEMRMTRQRSDIETITPTQAAELLNANTDNRPIRDSRVAELTRAIREGRWRLTNDAIAMTGYSHQKPGRLLNGQHRLFACTEAGLPIRVMVLYGADEGAYLVMDTGAKRVAADAIGGQNRAEKAAIATLLLHYERNTISILGKAGKYANDEIVAAVNSRPLIEETCATDMQGLRKIVRARSGVLAGFVLIREDNRRLADEFIANVLSGEGLVKDAPELALRNRLIAETARIRSNRTAGTTYMAMVIKAWNAKKSGGTMTRFQFSPGDAFPRVTAGATPPRRRPAARST